MTCNVFGGTLNIAQLNPPYVLLLSIPFLSTRIVPLRFQAGRRRKRPNLGLVCCVYILCSLYFLVKIDFDVLLYLV